MNSVHFPRKARSSSCPAEKLVEKDPSYCHCLIFTCCLKLSGAESDAWRPWWLRNKWASDWGQEGTGGVCEVQWGACVRVSRQSHPQPHRFQPQLIGFSRPAGKACYAARPLCRECCGRETAGGGETQGAPGPSPRDSHFQC